MKPEELIESTRLATFDYLLGQQTWTDKQYLIALNDARAYLYSKLPESRVTENSGMTAYASIPETALADTMVEDDIYRLFFIEYMAFRFYGGGTRDTANAQQTKEHQNNYLQALAVAGGR